MKIESVSSEPVPAPWPKAGAETVNIAPFVSDIRTGNRGVAWFVGSLVLPIVAALVLYGLTLVAQDDLTEPYLVLGLLTFALLYPGRWSTTVAGIDLGAQVVTPWLMVLGFLLITGWALDAFPRFDLRILLTWAVVTPLIQVAALHMLPNSIAWLVSLKRRRHRVVVVGANQNGLSFARALKLNPVAHSEVIAFFDDREVRRLGNLEDAPLVGPCSALRDFVLKHRVDQIYIALPVSSQPRITGMLESLRDSTASIYFVPDLMSMDLIQPRLGTHAGFPVVGVCESPFHGLDGAVKRGSDIVISMAAIVLLAPFLGAIALAVKLSSRGPVIFKQRRFGLDGSEIVVWKFRSMTVTEDGDATYRQVVRDDPRLTPIGAFLRKTSLDELPQFFNVLQGRMSIVGPRPHALKVNEQYRQLIPGYMIRHKVRPGITGWAQVNGYRGGDDLASMTKRVEYDLHYLKHWSVWMDIRILARTVALVIRDSSAY